MTFRRAVRHGNPYEATLDAARDLVGRAIGDSSPYSSSSSPSLLTSRSVAALSKRETATTAGLSPLAVIVVVGSLAVLWLIVVFIGIICKYTNKPRSAAHIGGYASTASSKMYQPSSAASPSSKSAGPDPKMYGSKANLLSGAGPIAGRGDESMGPDSPDVSFDGPSFGNAGSMPGQHRRTTSSSVGLPGPAAAARRGGPSNNASPSHPPLGSSQRGYGPDGSPLKGFSNSPSKSFGPGQIFGQQNGGPPAPGGPRLPRNQSRQGGQSPYGQYSQGPPPSTVGRSNSRVIRGPPPARANSNRRSRYYSGSPARVESLGSGEVRQSRYFDENDLKYEDGGTPNYSRRISRSAGGSASRRSQYGGSGFSNGAGLTKSPSIYGAKKLEGEALRKAQQEGWGAGSNENLHSIIANGNGKADANSPNQYRSSPASRADPLGAASQQGGSQYGRVGNAVQPLQQQGQQQARPRPQQQQQPQPYQQRPPAQSNGSYSSQTQQRYPAAGGAPAGTYAPGPFAVRPTQGGAPAPQKGPMNGPSPGGNGGGYPTRQPQMAGGAGGRQLL
jgi:hypothetical protein